MRLFFNPYKAGSGSIKLLKEATGFKALRKVNSRYRPRKGDVIVNWGLAHSPKGVILGLVYNMNIKVLNEYNSVARACDKIRAFKTMQGTVSIPLFTTDRAVAASWFVKPGTTVVCRTIVNGHEGRGIVLAESPDELVDAPLYTLYVPKKKEFRVHVAGNDVIDVTQKVLKKDHPDPDFRIRNTANGFVFKRNEIDIPEDVTKQAMIAVKVLGLDFGAVDVIWNEKYQKAYVLEVNTAPGIEGTTLQKYVSYFKRMVKLPE